MTQDEHMLKCSFSTGGGGCGSHGDEGGDGGGGGVGGGMDDGGGSRSKQIKQKKVPQRGLGVAQLEKIRLEEQRKKEAALQAANVLKNNAIGSHTDSTACLAISCPTFRPNHCPSSNSIPLPPPPPSDLPSPNFLYRPVQLSKNVKIIHSNSVQLSKPLNIGGNEIGLPAISDSGQGNWPGLWNGEQNLEVERQYLDHRRFAFWPRINFPYESNALVLPIPQRSHQFHHHSSSSMVNVSSGTSSSVLKFQMEPPSNQSFRDNYYASLSPKEEKMVGMKRLYPFSLESPTVPSCQCKFQPTYVTSISRSDESALCSNGCTNHLEPSNKYIRDDPPNTSPLPEQNASGVIIRENKEMNGDFLTLAPPVPPTEPLNLKHKRPLAYSGYQEEELYEFVCPSTQEFSKDAIQTQGPSRSIERPSFSFFPTKVQIDKATIHARDGIGEIAETVDLSLKL